MPLDVQPLTLRRQFVRLAVLIALLIASLGVAQYLTRSRRVVLPVVVDLESVGFTEAVLQDEPLDGELESRAGKVAGQMREVHVLYTDELSTAPQPLQLQNLFQAIFEVAPQTQSTVRLGGNTWLEQSGPTSDSEFAILRLLEVADRALVICYSGQGKKTDADTAALDAICTKAIHINVSAVPHPH